MVHRVTAARSGARVVLVVLALAVAGCGTPESSTRAEAGAPEESPTETPPPSPSEPVMMRTRIVESVATTTSDLPVEKLGRLRGTNNTSYDWDPSAPQAGTAASSARFDRGAIASLFTSLPSHDDVARVEAQLRNETDDRVLRIRGHVVYELRASDETTEHPSELLDVELPPGEQIKVIFVLELPSGEYEGSSSFRPAEDEAASG